MATLAFGAAVLLSLYVLFRPASDGALPFWQADKLVHAALFAVLAGTARWRFGASVLALGLLCAYAPASEVVQGVALAARDGDWHDALADLLGVAVGWLLAGAALRRVPR